MKNRFLLALSLMLTVYGPIRAQMPPEELAPPTPQSKPAPEPKTTTTAAPTAPATPFAPLTTENVVFPTEGDANFSGDASFSGDADPDTARFWSTGQLLASWIKGDRLPPLVTTSPAGTSSTTAGVLHGDSTILLGGSYVGNDFRAGGKFDVGYWISPDRFLGVESGFMAVSSQSQPYNFASNGSLILARPYVNNLNNTQMSLLVAYPTGKDKASGSINVVANSGAFYSFNFDFDQQWIDACGFKVTTLLGYRYFSYDESLNIQQVSNPMGGTQVAGTQIRTFDGFGTSNQFNGVEVGLRTQYTWESLSMTLLGKMAMGGLHRELKISGNTQNIVPGQATQNVPHGFLALASNIGDQTNDVGAALPELDFDIGWQATNHLRLTVGYSMLWENQMMRAADQVDINLNQSLLGKNPPATTPGEHPAVTFEPNNWWLQSLTVGVKFTY